LPFQTPGPAIEPAPASYNSELQKHRNKKKLMIIYGNPASNSVLEKMFFYSKGKKHHRHGEWEKYF
jgi:hypothetical protein